MDDDERAKIIQLVLDWYNVHLKHKLRDNEWTVLSGIVAVLPDQTLRLLSIGTGTKCVGQVALRSIYVVNDSHAEVIAKRAFQRFIHLERLHFLNGTPPPDSIFDANGCIRWPLYLYISQTPCGDASLYGDRIIGAKPIHLSEDRFMHQTIGLVRTKSGRSDLPPTHRTSSLSCTDKLKKWNVDGLMKGIFLNGVIVSCEAEESKEALSRIGGHTFVSNSMSFVHEKSDQRSTSTNLSFNWYCVPPYWTLETDATIETTIGTKGIPLGSRIGSAKTCSRLCKAAIRTPKIRRKRKR